MIPDSLYEAAFQFRKTKLWNQLYDSEIFAVKHSDGEIGYCCVMGIMGEHLALAVYPGAEGLEAYRLMGTDRSRLNDFEDQEIAFSQNCVMCSFENKDELRHRELEEVRKYCKEHYITLRGKNAYPQFQRFRPHHYPWYVDDEKDQTHLLDALKASIEISARLNSIDPAELGFTEGAPYNRTIPFLKKRGRGWTWDTLPLPEPLPVVHPSPEVDDEIRLARIKRQAQGQGTAKRNEKSTSQLNQINKLNGEWAFDILMYPKALAEMDDASLNYTGGGYIEGPEKAPFFPYMLLIADIKENAIVSMALSDNAEKYASQLCNEFLKAIEENGTPTKVWVRNERAYTFLQRIAEQLGFVLKQKKKLPKFEEMMQDVYDNFSQEQKTEYSQEEQQERFERLSDPKNLAMVPDPILRQMAQVIQQAKPGDLPDGVKEQILKAMHGRGIID